MISFNEVFFQIRYKEDSIERLELNMKHFLPSSVMLTPFVVRYYDEDDESENVETHSEKQDLDNDGQSKGSSE